MDRERTRQVNTEIIRAEMQEFQRQEWDCECSAETKDNCSCSKEVKIKETKQVHKATEKEFGEDVKNINRYSLRNLEESDK